MKKNRFMTAAAGILSALLVIGGIGGCGAVRTDTYTEAYTNTYESTSFQTASVSSVSGISTTKGSKSKDDTSNSKSSDSGTSGSGITGSETDKSTSSKNGTAKSASSKNKNDDNSVLDLSEIPAYSGDPYVEINDNEPFFTKSELTKKSFESYSELDDMGRCGVAYANIGQDLMPTEERGSIGSVKPTGWHTVKYSGIVDGNYLYNRCHLIGYQLSGENANEENLITGTRYLNVDGMLPFENMVADYVEETGNHVLYRVTPIFEDDNLVASGVLMEAESVEDTGDAILFCVYCYNVQPGIVIDYATGDSEIDENAAVSGSASNLGSDSKSGSKASSGSGSKSDSGSNTDGSSKTNSASDTKSTDYILNTNTMKFHKPGCSSIKQMNDANKKEFSGSRDDLIAQGYDPCKRCNP